ncbi:hypothetical protein EDB81DRAFT_912533 [Dactylonectria macrodidyma]|uniref:AttH domain-containing protein n=1 Tax=Dactylonectria macrodidyma TaxID=307937 RepID=A0A9P9IJD6_9HYPO|nr:hypothetical protein EDB81DRAFT_912533 [Dactylonectria macrodidyma]
MNLTESQYDVESGSSYWMSSFITSTKGKQYLALSHIMTPFKNLCRSSVLDLQSLQYWVHLTYCSSVENKASDTSGPLNADFDTYKFVSTASDSIANMYAYADTNASYSFNISWEATSKVLLNGGAGSIAFGTGPSNATEWGIPAAKTTGSLTLDGKSVEIDTKNSFTWYDRQISYGAPRNWTWFQLNFPGTEIKASVWAYDLGLPDNTTYHFATIRKGESQYVLAYDLIPDMSSVWVSPNSGLVYPLSWKLEFENGDHLVVKSIRPDQEMYGPDALVDTAYEGFITVSGKFFGQTRGFGVVELVTVY